MTMRRRLAHLLQQKYPYCNAGACYDRLFTATASATAIASVVVVVVAAGGDAWRVKYMHNATLTPTHRMHQHMRAAL